VYACFCYFKMPKKQLTIEERTKAITLLEEGYSYRQVASRLDNNAHPSTILRLKTKYEETGKVQNKPIPGRPRLLTVRDERKIIR
jgi:transposase